jgi:hypothetical protein
VETAIISIYPYFLKTFAILAILCHIVAFFAKPDHEDFYGQVNKEQIDNEHRYQQNA